MSTIKLKSFIKLLESVDPNKFVSSAISNLHSFRGEPEHLAASLSDGRTVGYMLEEARNAVGKKFDGYKGGEYKMHENTEIHFAFYGSCDENPVWLTYFINELFGD